MSGILVIGAGGHSKVIVDILCLQGHKILGFLDDNPHIWGTSLRGIPVLGAIDKYDSFDFDGIIIGIGANAIRKKVYEHLGSMEQMLWINAIHPKAVVASSAKLGKGIVAAAGAIINPDVTIGNHVIINTAASVDHDCIIEDYAHIAPGVHLAGNVKINEGALLGIGSSVIPNVTVGRWSTIAAGAVVIDNIPSGVIAKGVPSRWE